MSEKCNSVRPGGMDRTGNVGAALPADQRPFRITKSGRIAKPSKFRNIKTRCLSRHNHDSRHEADYCNRLMARVRNGDILGYDVQVPFELVVNDKLVCTHIVDFLIHVKFEPVYRNGVAFQEMRQEAHDAKGFRTDVWSIKYKLFKALFPKIEYVVVSKGKDRSPCKVNQKIRTMIKSSRSKKS